MSQDRERSDALAAGPSAEAAGGIATLTRLRVRCWGTRGSLPSPGPGTVRYGGNTSCVEVLDAGGHRLILDAGSGIRPLGEALSSMADAGPLELFLSHFHWDHIQGLPFFRPLYRPEASIRIHAARQGELSVQSLVAGQMGPVYFPVPFEALTGDLTFCEIGKEPFERGASVVRMHRLRHPTSTWGFRVESGGCSVVYIPDNELVGGSYDVPSDWYESLCSFAAGADLLLHDAMFSDAEYPAHEGWGHSTINQAIRFAEDAGVRRLLLFHHRPERSDDALATLTEQARDDLLRRGSSLELDVAAEGSELVVEERR
jgi:phosphoribosyl 1,2-cyclic phosphodiesterase